MTFIERCKQRFNKINSILSFGFDPIIEKFPDKFKTGDIESDLYLYFVEIVSNFSQYIYVIKPNIAFYEQYGLSGYKALKKIISYAKEKDIPIILDAKRGDIGATANCYAKACFEELNADAITLSPYLGTDSLEPFFKYKEKGFFILTRTSNKGGADFQLIKTEDNDFIYLKVAKKIIEWNKNYTNGIGAVIGATYLSELEETIKIFITHNEDKIPILLPGVGTQGADFLEVLNIFKKYNYPFYSIFINSSSKISYAHLEHKDKDYLSAIEEEINKVLLKNFLF
ncbi:MAG TPA: orotidine-5'-phosphate decarboxylase [Spirochaetota bacterium]|nr:orotidine-5'-phosphate decarboxylase [Spirochaetota bacterium]HOL57456.1 orotidine-5'-phosphate decarboxylase [Spirochaetota bacterium]HPP03618.1 orotidine-5'-phosphate decarboxylase [Spirochaetota bacterium]